MKIKYKNSGFSIVFAMGYIVILSLIVIVLMEYLVPFSKNVKGVENSSQAYYESLAGIEKALYDKKSLKLGDDKSYSTSGRKKYSYSLTASGKILPPIGKGDSEFDKDWNQISLTNSIQLKMEKKDVVWSQVKFYFRVPDLDGSYNETLEEIDGDKKIINWQLSGSGFVLNASTGSMISTDNINTNNFNTTFNLKKGIIIGTQIKREKLTDQNKKATMSFEDFFGGGNKTPDNYSEAINLTPCKNTTCTLKLSLINDLIVKQNGVDQQIPYLEYKITGLNTAIPTRFTRIKSDGFSSGFKKTIKIKIPQDSTIGAFDFTVFQ